MYRYRCDGCGSEMHFTDHPGRNPLCPHGCLHFMRIVRLTLTDRILEGATIPQRLRGIAVMMSSNRGARV
jgi:hypothetical protein